MSDMERIGEFIEQLDLIRKLNVALNPAEEMLLALRDEYQKLERQDQAVRGYLESLRPAVDVAESGTLIGEPKLLRCIIADLERAVEGNYPIPQHEVKRIAASLKED